MVHSEDEFRQTLRTTNASLDRTGRRMCFSEKSIRMLIDDSDLSMKLKLLEPDLMTAFVEY